MLVALQEAGAWDSTRHQMVARLAEANGVAEALWCAAPAVLEMLRLLWRDVPAPRLGRDGMPLGAGEDVAADTAIAESSDEGD